MTSDGILLARGFNSRQVHHFFAPTPCKPEGESLLYPLLFLQGGAYIKQVTNFINEDGRANFCAHGHGVSLLTKILVIGRIESLTSEGRQTGLSRAQASVWNAGNEVLICRFESYWVRHLQAHRTWFKVLFNPILRKLGWSICSVFDDETRTLIGYKILPYPENCKVSPKEN